MIDLEIQMKSAKRHIHQKVWLPFTLYPSALILRWFLLAQMYRLTYRHTHGHTSIRTDQFLESALSWLKTYEISAFSGLSPSRMQNKSTKSILLYTIDKVYIDGLCQLLIRRSIHKLLATDFCNQEIPGPNRTTNISVEKKGLTIHTCTACIRTGPIGSIGPIYTRMYVSWPLLRSSPHPGQ